MIYKLLLSFLMAGLLSLSANARSAADVVAIEDVAVVAVELASPDSLVLEQVDLSAIVPTHSWISPYELPYSFSKPCNPNWHRMWINTAILSSAFIGTLFVLECLPEDATTWNRAALQQTPMFKRWFRNVFKRGPEWDHDKFIFNYVLHPYAGAAYFMTARSCGFSFWQSLLYSACISNIGWEFGIEAFMERPSYQDLVITPVVGSCIGELFYHAKRYIVAHDYRLLGSPIIGHVCAFLLDPVNEVIDLVGGHPGSSYVKSYFSPNSLSVSVTF